MPGGTKCCTCHAKSSQQTWISQAPRGNPSQRPDLLTALMNMSLVLRLPRKMHLGRSSSNVPRLPSFLEMLQNPDALLTFDWQGAQSLAPATRNDIWTSKSGPSMVCFLHFDFEICFTPQRRALFRHLNFQKWSEHGVFCTFWLRNLLRTTTACTFSTSQLPKVVRAWCVFYILTSKFASHHNGVHFFDISTSKSGPSMVCFLHFDFEMCFTPQRHALFRHLNFQKWSEHGVFSTFWLQNVLRTTTVCTFSTSQLLKALWSWGVLYILTSECASRHNGVQFFISHLARWLRTRRFSQPTFQATNHWKTSVFRHFPTFSCTWIFFLLTLYLLSSSLFYSSLLSDSSHLCFSSVHIVGSLTSKLPSNTVQYLLLLDLVVSRFFFDSAWDRWIERIGRTIPAVWWKPPKVSPHSKAISLVKAFNWEFSPLTSEHISAIMPLATSCRAASTESLVHFVSSGLLPAGW